MLDWNYVDAGRDDVNSAWVAHEGRWTWLVYIHIAAGNLIWDYVPEFIPRDLNGQGYVFGAVTVTSDEEELFLPAGRRYVFVARATDVESGKRVVQELSALDLPSSWDGSLREAGAAGAAARS